MGQPRTQEFFCFALHVILDPANGDALSVHHQIGGACISVIGLADAAGIRHSHTWKPANVRTMNMSVDHDSREKRRIGTLQFVVAGIGHGSAPEVIGACMNQAEAFARVLLRKSFQPSQAFFTDAGERRRNHLLDDGKKWPELWSCGGKSCQTFRCPKHLIGIPADPGPSERADLIDDVRRVRSTVSQIAPMENEVRRDLPQVGDNRPHADQPSDGTVVQNSGRTRVVNLFFSTDKDYLFMTFRYVGDFLAAGDFGCRGRARPKKFEGATAVKLVAPSNGAVKFLSFAIQSRGATAVKLAAPSKLIRKVLKLPGSIWVAR